MSRDEDKRLLDVLRLLGWTERGHHAKLEATDHNNDRLFCAHRTRFVIAAFNIKLYFYFPFSPRNTSASLN